MQLMRVTLFIAAAALVAAGCGKKDDGKKAGGADKSAGTGDTATGAAGKSGKKELEVPKLEDPKSLFASGKPALAGPFASIALGETKSSAVGEYLFAYPPKEVAPGVSLYASRDIGKRGPDDPVVAVSAELSGETGNNAKAWAAEAWGAPVDADDNSGTKINGQVLPAHYWFDPAGHLYAKLLEGTPGKWTLSFHKYMPLAEIIGEGKETFGFEKDKPLLGATTADLEAAYGTMYKNFGKNGKIELPAYEHQHERGTTSVHWKAPEGTVTEYMLSLGYEKGVGDPRQQILDMLAKKFGEPKEEEISGQKHLIYSQKPAVSLFEQTGSKSFQITVKPGE